MVNILRKNFRKLKCRLFGCRTAFFYKTSRVAGIFIALFVLFNLWGCATAPHRRVPLQGVYHIVGSGQTIYRIAKTYNVEVNVIMLANHISDSTKIGVGQQLFIPGAKRILWIEPYRPAIKESVEKIVGQKNYFSKWKYITLHHSATLQGNAERFDKYHRSRGMGGLFYHFVIGNGTASDNGEIEVGWRWQKQAQVNRPYDIQICLVGNFNEQQVSKTQFKALVELINVLRKQYGVPISNIRGHKDIKGCITECPGNYFPLDRIKTELRKTNPY